MTTEAAIILALSDGPSSGVGIMERLRRSGSGPGAGTLYPLVRRLDQGGLVRTWIESERSSVGRPRRFLELTARGVARLGQVEQELLDLGAGRARARRRVTGRRMVSNLRRAFRVSAFALQLRQAGTAR